MNTVNIVQDNLIEGITLHPYRNIAANNSRTQDKSTFLDCK